MNADNNDNFIRSYTGKTPCKYGPVFALYLYRIESNRVNTVQKRVRIYTAFFLWYISLTYIHAVARYIFGLLWKTFIVPCLYLHSQKYVHGYQLIQAFVVFICKNLPENFHGCKVIHKKHESFSPWIISNIWYVIFWVVNYKSIENWYNYSQQ